MAKTINVISCVGQSNPHHRSRRDMSRVYMDDSTPFMGFRKAGTCYTLRSHKSSPPLDPYNASNQSVLLSQTRKKRCTRYQIHRNTGTESRRTWAAHPQFTPFFRRCFPLCFLGGKGLGCTTAPRSQAHQANFAVVWLSAINASWIR
jgi:hypothetical protein